MKLRHLVALLAVLAMIAGACGGGTAATRSISPSAPRPGNVPPSTSIASSSTSISRPMGRSVGKGEILPLGIGQASPGGARWGVPFLFGQLGERR